MKDELIFVVGATCSGKTTLISRLYNDYGIDVLPTYRNRDSRYNEQDDFANIFLTDHKFVSLESEHFFTHVETFKGKKYGFKLTFSSNLRIATMSPSGALFLKKKIGAKICKLYCNKSTLVERIFRRIDLNDKEAVKRFKSIQSEIIQINNLDADLVLNTDTNIEDTVKEFMHFVS